MNNNACNHWHFVSVCKDIIMIYSISRLLCCLSTDMRYFRFCPTQTPMLVCQEWNELVTVHKILCITVTKIVSFVPVLSLGVVFILSGTDWLVRNECPLWKLRNIYIYSIWITVKKMNARNYELFEIIPDLV